jgi:Na+/H+ antiporter NhaD/arsenite permease-like protein
VSAGIAVGVFVVAYVLIATERIPKTIAALAGAAVVLALGVVGSEDAFYSHDTGVDWDVIFLLLGMMIIVSVLRRTGVFEYIAIWSAKRAHGSPLRVMVLLVLVSGLRSGHYLGGVEWETLLFFAGLFIMIGAMVKTGVIGQLARLATEATGGDALLAVMLILFVSALLSGIIDNIPYVAAMSPLVADLARGIDNPVHADALWWSLALGADFGGNLTAIGASANVVVLGIAMRAGTPISFWEFTRKGAIVTVITIALAAPYLWLRYFVLA